MAKKETTQQDLAGGFTPLSVREGGKQVLAMDISENVNGLDTISESEMFNFTALIANIYGPVPYIHDVLTGIISEDDDVKSSGVEVKPSDEKSLKLAAQVQALVVERDKYPPDSITHKAMQGEVDKVTVELDDRGKLSWKKVPLAEEDRLFLCQLLDQFSDRRKITRDGTTHPRLFDLLMRMVKLRFCHPISPEGVISKTGEMPSREIAKRIQREMTDIWKIPEEHLTKD